MTIYTHSNSVLLSKVNYMCHVIFIFNISKKCTFAGPILHVTDFII